MNVDEWHNGRDQRDHEQPGAIAAPARNQNGGEVDEKDRGRIIAKRFAENEKEEGVDGHRQPERGQGRDVALDP